MVDARDMDIGVNINLSGLDDVNEAVRVVFASLEGLHKSISDLNRAVRKMGIEINQPTAGTDG